jgi:serine phosphatase RsbU (regulator of sigma subunit)
LAEERERSRTSLIANALQKGLRNELPPTPGVTARSLYVSATASAVVGGDFFDLYGLADGRVVVVMGDVSGKGVGAAATASFIKTVLAAYAWSGFDPASMVSSLNDLLLNFSRPETFATLVVVLLDPATSTLTYCSAGHPPAMLVHRPEAAERELELLTVQSPIVGAFENLGYENGRVTLDRGDVVFLYTDGTTEARDPGGSFFGEDALSRILLDVCPRGVEAIPDLVHEAVVQFADGRLHDDMALVAVRYDGLDEGAGCPSEG